jgi:hypothetical protein
MGIIVEDFVRRFDLEDFVVVADSVLMNLRNISMMESEGYKYIVRARIKNANKSQWNGYCHLINVKARFMKSSNRKDAV